MNLIVAVDEKWGIGKNGGLLAHLSSDLKYFKEKTAGKVVVMGRKTLESLPAGKPLPNRTNIVLSASLDSADGYTVCKDRAKLDEKLAEYDTNDVFIIGGAKVYSDFMSECTDFYLTFMQADLGADKFIPNILEIPGIKKIWESETITENGINYKFTHFRR
ncbi:MAG: dihydrofolate reductase [Eubacteriales bacterium]